MAIPSARSVFVALAWLAIATLVLTTAFFLAFLAWRGLWVEACDVSASALQHA